MYIDNYGDVFFDNGCYAYKTIEDCTEFIFECCSDDDPPIGKLKTGMLVHMDGDNREAPHVHVGPSHQHSAQYLFLSGELNDDPRKKDRVLGKEDKKALEEWLDEFLPEVIWLWGKSRCVFTRIWSTSWSTLIV